MAWKNPGRNPFTLKQVKDSYFGCGLPYPGAVEGTRVLDLGSGTGRDVFLLSKLAGPKGSLRSLDQE